MSNIQNVEMDSFFYGCVRKLVLHLFMNKVLPVTYKNQRSGSIVPHCRGPAPLASPLQCRMCACPLAQGLIWLFRVPSWLDSVFWLLKWAVFREGLGRESGTRWPVFCQIIKDTELTDMPGSVVVTLP